MRVFALALICASCAPFVRPSDSGEDAGLPTASVLDVNGALLTPGVFTQISPNAVATSPKFYLRQASGNEPDCWYGVFVADPAAVASGQPNNGVLISALGNMVAINGDTSLGGTTRSTCPLPEAYPAGVGGNIPDNVQVGDRLSVTGYFEPFCNYYNTSAGVCSAALFPEFSPDPPAAGNVAGVVKDLGAGSAIAPVAVQPAQISDLSVNAIQWAGELVTVQNVTVASADPQGDVILSQSSLWVRPELSTVTVEADAGVEYCSITGNVHYNGSEDSHWEVRPRSQADLVAAPCP